MAPALLDELLGEIGSLASAYHEPAKTFIGHGRVAADSVRKGEEYVKFFFLTLAFFIFYLDWQRTINFRLRKHYRLSLLVDRQRICCKGDQVLKQSDVYQRAAAQSGEM